MFGALSPFFTFIARGSIVPGAALLMSLQIKIPSFTDVNKESSLSLSGITCARSLSSPNFALSSYTKPYFSSSVYVCSPA